MRPRAEARTPIACSPSRAPTRNARARSQRTQRLTLRASARIRMRELASTPTRAPLARARSARGASKAITPKRRPVTVYDATKRSNIDDSSQKRLSGGNSRIAGREAPEPVRCNSGGRHHGVRCDGQRRWETGIWTEIGIVISSNRMFRVSAAFVPRTLLGFVNTVLRANCGAGRDDEVTCGRDRL